LNSFPDIVDRDTFDGATPSISTVDAQVLNQGVAREVTARLIKQISNKTDLRPRQHYGTALTCIEAATKKFDRLLCIAAERSSSVEKSR
jgi:hypothetical protein